MEPIKTIELDNDSLHWVESGYQSRSVNPAIQRLLNEKGSLTQQLIDVSNDRFRVQPVELDGEISETTCGNCSVRLLHRINSGLKTVLLCESQPTVWPTVSWRTQRVRSWSGFELGEQPLGEYLFSQSGLKRVSFQFAQSEQGFWGRRSIFYEKCQLWLLNFPAGKILIGFCA